MHVHIYSAFFHCMIQSVKMHLELSHNSRFGAENIFISFHIVNISRRVLFFSPKVSMITNVILIL